MKTRKILTAVGVAVALLIGPATMASAYEGNGYSVRVSVNTQVVGQPVTVTIRVPAGVRNVKVRITFPTLDSSQITVLGVKEVVRPVGADGAVNVSFSTARSAQGFIEVFNADTGQQIGGKIPVTFLASSGEAGGGGGLPMTGAEVAPLAIGAGVLLAGGATAVAVARRRRRA